MYAVIQSGGRQYRVEQGQRIKLEKLPEESGNEITFSEVLLVHDGDTAHVGVPFVVDGAVVGTVVEQGRHRKINIIKFKRRKQYLKRQGHRQPYTEVEIKGIKLAGRELAGAEPAKKAAAKKPTVKKKSKS